MLYVRCLKMDLHKGHSLGISLCTVRGPEMRYIDVCCSSNPRIGDHFHNHLFPGKAATNHDIR